MKLFCIVLVIYVLTLTLCGVDGRGGGNRNGLEVSQEIEPIIILKDTLNSRSTFDYRSP